MNQVLAKLHKLTKLYGLSFVQTKFFILVIISVGSPFITLVIMSFPRHLILGGGFLQRCLLFCHSWLGFEQILLTANSIEK